MQVFAPDKLLKFLDLKAFNQFDFGGIDLKYFTTTSSQVQITKFVVASQSSDEAEHCEATDLDVDLDDMEHVNEDSFITAESTDEQKAMFSTAESEEDLLYDPADITGGDELQENQPSMVAEPQVSRMFCA